jgi:hypothetical protein
MITSDRPFLLELKEYQLNQDKELSNTKSYDYGDDPRIDDMNLNDVIEKATNMVQVYNFTNNC